MVRLLNLYSGMRWFLMLTLVTALPACAALHPIPPSPPTHDGYALKRFWRVDAEVYSGAQPTPEQMRELAERYGIKTVIKLSPNWQGRTQVPPGVTLLYRPIGAIFAPSTERIDGILDDIDRAEKPVFIHCRLGADRTQLIVALYRMRHGMSAKEAEALMIAHGYRPYRGVSRVWRMRSVKSAAPLRAAAAARTKD